MAKHAFGRFLWAMMSAGVVQGLLAQVLYVPNQGEGTISSFVYDLDTGRLTEIGPRLPTGGSPAAIAIHPSGKFALVANAAGGGNPPSLATLSINPATGALARTSSAPLVPGSGPVAVSVDAAGKFAFVAHAAVTNGASIVSAFAIDASSGAPSAVPGSPFQTAAGASSVVVHPNGNFVYVSAATAGQVAVFSIAANGALTPVSGSPFAARTAIAWMAMDTAGKFLFVAQRQDNDNGILAYSVDSATGALSPVPGSPFSIGNTFLTGVAVDPSGRFLYASDLRGVFRFAIGANGALTQPLLTRTVVGVSAAIMDPSGKFLYVPGGTQSNIVIAYKIDSGTGTLTSIGPPYTVGANPQRGAAALFSPAILPPMGTDAVFNEFSRAPAGMPNAGIAQGSLLGIRGKNIGPAEPIGADSTLATELGGVSVQIRSGDVVTQGLVNWVSDGYVNCVVPSTTPPGDATVTVIYRGRTTSPFPITVVKASPGVHTLNNAGYGPARAWNVPPDIPLRLDESVIQVPNDMYQSAKPGQVMVVEATGLGPVTADETAARVLVELDAPAEVIVGNKPAAILAKVRGGYGSDFIVFKLPDDVLQGCLVPIAVQAGGVTGNVATVSIAANGGACSDPTGFSTSDIETAQKSGLNVAVVQFHRLDFAGDIDSEARGRFIRYDPRSFRTSFAAISADAGIRGDFGVPPLGSCSVVVSPEGDPDGDPAPGQQLNVGQALNLTGPKGSVQLNAPGYLVRSDGEFFTPGDYTVDNGAGNANFGAFRAAITLPPPVQWTNQGALASVDRAQSTTFTWSGGLADKEFVMILGFTSNGTVSAGFGCAERVSAGQFTVPTWVLSSLPVLATGKTEPFAIMGIATAPLTSAGRFTARGLDFGVFTYEQAKFNFVTIR